MSLARHEGVSLYSAGEAMLKGVLEADTTVELVAAARSEAFSPLCVVARNDAVAPLLASHGTRVVEAPDGSRAVSLAARAAVTGQRAFALLPNDQLDLAMPAISRACATPLGGGALCLVLEDDPRRCRPAH